MGQRKKLIFLTQSSSWDELHCKPGCSQLDVGDLFESSAVGVTNFSFEGHCAMANAEENDVQENLAMVTAKKGKKRGIKAINWFQVNNPYL